MCRTANGWDVNGLGQLKDGRGNICPVTIIMPTLAMMAKEDWSNAISTIDGIQINPEDYFMSLLDKKIHEAKDMLIERFEWICSQSPDSAKFMYENGLMAVYASLTDVDVSVGDSVKQGEVIARAGSNTVNSSMGNHLNFSLLLNNKKVNPLNYYSKVIKEI